jgi:hypothetical protein
VYEDDTLLLGDWKTGKKYFANEEQMELFALAGYSASHSLQKWIRGCGTRTSEPDDNEIDMYLHFKELDARSSATGPSAWFPCSRTAASRPLLTTSADGARSAKRKVDHASSNYYRDRAIRLEQA